MLPNDPTATFDAVTGAHGDSSLDGVSESLLPTQWVPYKSRTDNEASHTIAPYVFKERVGRGGFGEVWEAVQTSLNRSVAVKQMRIERAAPDAANEMQEMFRHEAFTMAALEHPNIVPVYDYGLDEAGRPMLAMKLIRGENWNQVIKRDFLEMSASEFLARHLQVLADVSQAVVFAHDAGIVHRDLKPAQVMLGPYGEVLLTDWGLAVKVGEPVVGVAMSADPDIVAPITEEASAPAGTPSFMAPEHTLTHARDIGPWTDIYLLGGILFKLLVGVSPHPGGNSDAAFDSASKGIVRDLAEAAQGRYFPPDLAALALQALSVAPRDRVPSARDFLNRLNEHITGSTRRRESIEITKEVSEAAKDAASDYTTLNSLVNRIDRARVLWAENEEAESIRESLLARQTEVSLKGGDLLLAQVTIERLSSPALREKLFEKLNQKSTARRRRERERLVLKLATAVLAIVVLAGGAWFLWSLEHERNLAALARDRADVARVRAEDLLGFMIGDLRERLEPVGRLDVLDAVAEKAETYLDSLPEEDVNLTTWLQRTKTRTQIGMLRKNQGRLGVATEILEQQLNGLEERLAEHGVEKRTLSTAAHTASELGQAYFESGELLKARRTYVTAGGYFDTLAAMEPGNWDWVLGKADTLRGVGETLAMHDDWEGSKEPFRENIQLLSDAKAKGASGIQIDKDLSSAYHRLGVTKVMLFEEDAFDYLLKPIEILEDAAEKYPDDLTVVNLLGEMYTALGSSYTTRDRTSEALSANRRSVELMRSIVERDSANLEWMSDLVLCLAAYGRSLHYVHQNEEAVSILEEAVELSRELAVRNPSNLEWLRDYGSSTNYLGGVYEAIGRDEDAALIRLEGMEVMLECLSKDSNLRNHNSIFNSIKRASISHADSMLAAKRVRIPALVVNGMVALVEEFPDSLNEPHEYLQELNDVSMNLGRWMMETGDALTLGNCSDVLTSVTLIALESDSSASVSWGVRHSQIFRGRSKELNGDIKGGYDLYVEAEDGFRAMRDSHVEGLLTRAAIISSGARARSAMLLQSGQPEISLRILDELFVVLSLFDDYEDASQHLKDLGEWHRAAAHVLRGRAHRLLGDEELAQEDWKEAISILQPFKEDEAVIPLIPLAKAYWLVGREEEGTYLTKQIEAQVILPPSLTDVISEVVGRTSEPTPP